MESYICTVLICMITLNVLNILVFENNRIKKEKKNVLNILVFENNRIKKEKKKYFFLPTVLSVWQ